MKDKIRSRLTIASCLRFDNFRTICQIQKTLSKVGDYEKLKINSKISQYMSREHKSDTGKNAKKHLFCFQNNILVTNK